MNSELEQSAEAEAIIRELAERRGASCADCSIPVSSHQMLMNIALGFKDAPRCLDCLAKALGRDMDELRDQLIDYLHHRHCYRAAWDWADRDEGAQAFRPSRAPAFEPYTGTLVHAAEWDAGDMGCGDLVLELRVRLQAMKAGEIMKLCARDPGAPEDLPAWCRLTGHVLLRAEHPTYWIKRKE